MGENMSAIMMELHAVSSACKPVCTWLARDGIQECRESCGGHGYLKCSGLGDLRNDNDANCTYEGENNTLIQQASNWLISLHRNKSNLNNNSPMGSVEFLIHSKTLRKSRAQENTPQEVMMPSSRFEFFQISFILLRHFTKLILKENTNIFQIF